VRRDPALSQGANVWRGEIVCQGVAESLGLPYRPVEELI
jgi:alanine dehydrogenase